jgi:AraC-like DNA-binding protein
LIDDCTSIPAPHSWGLVFASQSATKSRQVLEPGAAKVAEDTTRQVLPTATGFAAKEAIAALRKHDVEIAPLLRRAGLSEHDLTVAEIEGNPTTHRISAVAQVKFLDYAAEAMNDTAFGLHLAGQIDPRDVGIFFYVGSAASDVGEALALYSRYSRIANQAVRQKLTPRFDGAVLEIEFAGVQRYAARHNTEFIFGCLRTGLRAITGRNVTPTRVAFSHNRNSNLREFERFFGCPVEFGAQANLLGLADDALRIPLLTADPKLLLALRPFCDMAAEARGTASGTLRSAVEKEVERLLPHGKAKAQTVAKNLALSRRTLSRRLADEGTTHGEVVDQLRRSLALQYLKEPGMSVSQIAWLLGYEGSTSFNHAFRRWTGESPSAARNQRLVTAPLA